MTWKLFLHSGFFYHWKQFSQCHFFSLTLFIRKFINFFFHKTSLLLLWEEPSKTSELPNPQMDKSDRVFSWLFWCWALHQFHPHNSSCTNMSGGKKILGWFYFLCVGDNLQCEIPNFSFKFALLHPFKYHKRLPLNSEAAAVVPIIILILLRLSFFPLFLLERTRFCWIFWVGCSKKLMSLDGFSRAVFLSMGYLEVKPGSNPPISQ